MSIALDISLKTCNRVENTLYHFALRFLVILGLKHFVGISKLNAVVKDERNLQLCYKRILQIWIETQHVEAQLISNNNKNHTQIMFKAAVLRAAIPQGWDVFMRGNAKLCRCTCSFAAFVRANFWEQVSPAKTLIQITFSRLRDLFFVLTAFSSKYTNGFKLYR